MNKNKQKKKKEIQPEEMSVCHSVILFDRDYFFLFHCRLSLSQVKKKPKTFQ